MDILSIISMNETKRSATIRYVTLSLDLQANTIENQLTFAVSVSIYGCGPHRVAVTNTQ